MNKQGKLIVFEGIDGAGKTTQIELLKKFLVSQGLAWEAISFPQYRKNEYADKIKDYLSGKLGEIDDVDPYKVAQLYANDRKTAKDSIKKWMEKGKLVIANRYISSSKAHLGANLPDDKKEEFIRWIDQLEYEENEMPRENLTILLNVDPRIGQKNSQEKDHPDLHEDNLTHEERANKIFLDLANSNPNWYVVDCMDNGKMKTKDVIHEEIMKILAKHI